MSDAHVTHQFMNEIAAIADELDIKNYQAFPIWICRNILGMRGQHAIDDAVAVGGPGDHGINIFHIDDSSAEMDPCVYWIQAKFSERLDHRVTREEMLSFKETPKRLAECLDTANSAFKRKFEEFRRIRNEHDNVRMAMIYVVTGFLGPQAQEVRKELEGASFEDGTDIQVRVWEMPDIMSWIVTPHTPDLKVSFDGEVINRTDKTTGKKSIIGYVNAQDLVKSIRPYRGTIFLTNPLEYLVPSTDPNKEINKTIRDDDRRNRFWKLNNGITGICDSFRRLDSSKNEFVIENFKVVNGRQTTFILTDTDRPLDDVFVSLVIHEAGSEEEYRDISMATNTQNPIKPIDLITRQRELGDLVVQCRDKYADFYFERQTGGFDIASSIVQSRVTKRRVLYKMDSARAYYAYAIDPNGAMMNDRIMFSTAEPAYFNMIYKDRDVRDLIIPHIFMESLEEMCRAWKKKAKDVEIPAGERKQHVRNADIFDKRITRYFVLRFISITMSSVGDEQRIRLEDKIIDIFRRMKKKDGIPAQIMDVVEAACLNFMLWFDTHKQETWPPELIEKRTAPGYVANENDLPTPYDIMYMLKKSGPVIFSTLNGERKGRIASEKRDPIREVLERITAGAVGT